MFDHKHYVCVLKTKEGEFRALGDLPTTTKGAMTPLLEVPGIPWDYANGAPATDIDGHLARIPAKVQKHWGTSHFFCDLWLIDDDEVMSDKSHPVKWLFAEFRALGFKAVPVTGLDRDADYQAAVATVVAADKRGLCLRLTMDDLENVSALAAPVDKLLADFKLAPKDVDLVLDFGSMGGGTHVPFVSLANACLTALPHVRDWRTLTLAGAAFPENLSGFASSTIDHCPRTEWTTWLNVRAGHQKIPRVPTYGDYAIAHPEIQEVDPRVMQMSASLRYTATATWLIAKGQSTKKAGFTQMHTICKNIVPLPEYSGRAFSAADKWIDDCSQVKDGPGNPTTWRQVGTNHHIEFVVKQIASLPAI